MFFVREFVLLGLLHTFPYVVKGAGLFVCVAETSFLVQSDLYLKASKTLLAEEWVGLQVLLIENFYKKRERLFVLSLSFCNFVAENI